MITFPSDAEVVTASTSAAGGFVHSPYPYRTEDTILDLEEHYAPSPTSPVFPDLICFVLGFVGSCRSFVAPLVLSSTYEPSLM
ncbi:uncharacterized protein ARMOST_08726 [Armillaria ostoyae]|uniref:Uncharacterized protein n=1 Tax=Armillaria ostoyae TaxID=47428 RepID=A0A284R9I4_ARMOS|nr:uncharacterized protein ARMOST_08726 [Armillaria ostoyae]